MGGCVSQPVQFYCTLDFVPLGVCHGEYHARGGMRPGLSSDSYDTEVIIQESQQQQMHTSMGLLAVNDVVN